MEFVHGSTAASIAGGTDSIHDSVIRGILVLRTTTLSTPKRVIATWRDQVAAVPRRAIATRLSVPLARLFELSTKPSVTDAKIPMIATPIGWQDISLARRRTRHSSPRSYHRANLPLSRMTYNTHLRV